MYIWGDRDRGPEAKVYIWGDRDRGPGSSYSMDKPFLILLLSNSPPLTSGLQPSGRGQQPQLGQQPETGAWPQMGEERRHTLFDDQTSIDECKCILNEIDLAGTE